VDGVVYAELAQGDSPLVQLPDIDVELQDRIGTMVARAKSDFNGGVELPWQIPGEYRICAHPKGFEKSCSELVSVTRGVEFALLTLKPEPASTVLSGRVLFQSGQPCFASYPYFDVRAAARVTAVGANGEEVGATVRVNSAGQYVIAGVGPGARVRVSCDPDLAHPEKTDHGKSVEPGVHRMGGVMPTLKAPRVRVGLKTVTAVPPGSTVTLAADRAAGPWKAPVGTLKQQRAPGEATWTLPKEAGLYNAYALAHVAGAGYLEQRVSLIVDPNLTAVSPTVASSQCLGSEPRPSTDDCRASVPGPELPLPDPPTGTGPQNPFFQRKTSTAQDADTYYKMIDPLQDEADGAPPQSRRGTLGGFWDTNHFTPEGRGTTVGDTNYSARYLNGGDLGFGRAMECVKDGTNVACCVTNYGYGNQDCCDVATATQVEAPGKAGAPPARATVCMEYSPQDGAPDQTPIVKFYAYLGAARGTALSKFADLGPGPRYLPGLCLNCHGGSWRPGQNQGHTTGDASAYFLPFDLATFGFASDPGKRRADQEAVFKNLNFLVRDTTHPSPAIVELINNWYTSDGTTAREPLPKGWQGLPACTGGQASDLYTKVIAFSCRTCHVAQRNTVAFNSYAQFAALGPWINAAVCKPKPYMPHAPITYKNYWSNYFFPDEAKPVGPMTLASLSCPAAGGFPAWDAGVPCP
jgi:hypothetical protein